MWVFNFLMFPASNEQTGHVVLGFVSGIICSGIEANSLMSFPFQVFTENRETNGYMYIVSVNSFTKLFFWLTFEMI